MKVLIFGAGNLLLSDEGFGVHLVKYLADNYRFDDQVELYDGGTLGFMASHKLEEADRVYMVDVITTPGEPGALFRFEKDAFIGRTIPIKMSPHQLGIQEMLLLSEIRGRCLFLEDETWNKSGMAEIRTRSQRRSCRRRLRS